VNIDLDFQYLAVSYGLVTEPLPALPIARVGENVIEELRTVGRMVWDNLLFSDEFVLVSFDKREGSGN
jgi:hypothetical protein